MSLFSRIPFNKKQIEAAISRLELNSSAELRVYIERHINHSSHSAYNRALEIFDNLAMGNTKLKNAVLIYIAHKDHQCAIIGDIGIHQYVGDDFWRMQCDEMVNFFKANQYSLGVVRAIDQIGEKLALYFPIQENDQNELDNEVIIND